MASYWYVEVALPPQPHRSGEYTAQSKKFDTEAEATEAQALLTTTLASLEIDATVDVQYYDPFEED